MTHDTQHTNRSSEMARVVFNSDGKTEEEAGADTGSSPTACESSVKAQREWRFWAISPALCITSLLAAVEGTVTSTALPTIVYDLDVGENYVWIVNAFFLTR